MIYRADRHVINLFTWPTAYSHDGSGPEPVATLRQGFHILHWTRNGMTYWVISDAGEERLRQLARLLSPAG